MAKQVKLAAQQRTGVGRSAVRKLKTQGLIPAVIYGGKEEPRNLQLSARAVANLFSHAAGENILVDLDIDESGQQISRMALVQAVQHEPISGRVTHVDFQAVRMDELLRANVPVEALGEALGVKSSGGILEQSLRTLEIECLPKDLPDVLTIDVSHLDIGDAVHVSEIQLPPGVKALDAPDQAVFLVAAPTVIEEVVPSAEAVPTEPEVIKEKKEGEPEGGAPAEGKSAEKK
jgi:large subunit ribosomal protein L25